MTISEEQPADWLCDVLSRHDPLGAWSPTMDAAHDYRQVAQLVAPELRRITGLGHAWTIVADALDREHPGFYRTSKQGDSEELKRRLGKVAREIWDRHVKDYGLVGRRAGQEPDKAIMPPPHPAVASLVADEHVLTAWLRTIEDSLAAEGSMRDRPPSKASLALREVLPPLAEAYASATGEERESIRLSFSRFRRVLHELSGCIASQNAILRTDGGTNHLRLALLLESILDLGMDWRDELLTLQAMRRTAEKAGLPFADLVREVAALSSQRGCEFLLGLNRAR
jgi:hypothetical protein